MTMAYEVRSYDNFHFNEPGESPSMHGTFEAAAEASAAARTAIDESLAHLASGYRVSRGSRPSLLALWRSPDDLGRAEG